MRLAAGKMLSTSVKKKVVGGECDELAPTPKHLAKPVGEVGNKPCRHRGGVGTQFLEAEHDRRARTEEPLGKLTSTPSSVKSPTGRQGLDDDSRGVPPLWHGGRQAESRPVLLHLAVAARFLWLLVKKRRDKAHIDV